MNRKISFLKSGYVFILLIFIAVLGFWETYFVKFFNGSNDISFYIHFHFFTVTMWMGLLILQPILIKKKRFSLHKLIGKLSYVIFPILLISVVLLAHNNNSIDEPNIGLDLFLPFKDIILLLVSFYIAIRYRKTANIHARGMIATGIIFIEPALVRLINNYIIPLPEAYILNMLLIYAVLGYLIFRERKSTSGRWVFPIILVLYIIVHSVVITGVKFEFWNSFTLWFLNLPLT
jgi:hypothetical protein